VSGFDLHAEPLGALLGGGALASEPVDAVLLAGCEVTQLGVDEPPVRARSPVRVGVRPALDLGLRINMPDFAVRRNGVRLDGGRVGGNRFISTDVGFRLDLCSAYLTGRRFGRAQNRRFRPLGLLDSAAECESHRRGGVAHMRSRQRLRVEPGQHGLDVMAGLAGGIDAVDDVYEGGTGDDAFGEFGVPAPRAPQDCRDTVTAGGALGPQLGVEAGSLDGLELGVGDAAQDVRAERGGVAVDSACLIHSLMRSNRIGASRPCRSSMIASPVPSEAHRVRVRRPAGRGRPPQRCSTLGGLAGVEVARARQTSRARWGADGTPARSGRDKVP
jgi:hypothetical protein